MRTSIACKVHACDASHYSTCSTWIRARMCSLHSALVRHEDNSFLRQCRGLIEDTVRGLILTPSAGEEVKALIPVAQWQRVSCLLVSLVDALELPSLRKSACEACQVCFSFRPPVCVQSRRRLCIAMRYVLRQTMLLGWRCMNRVQTSKFSHSQKFLITMCCYAQFL